eukprot:7383670-Prymnesium_polylepis.1
MPRPPPPVRRAAGVVVQKHVAPRDHRGREGTALADSDRKGGEHQPHPLAEQAARLASPLPANGDAGAGQREGAGLGP